MRKKSHQRGARKAGLPPGTLVYVGDRPTPVGKIRMFSFDEHDLAERAEEHLQDCLDRIVPGRATWIDIDGVNRPGLLESLGQRFELHPLTLEDILNTEQRPKFEDYGGYLYVVLKMIEFDEHTLALGIEQLSLVLGPDYLVSIQERPGDMFDPVRERLRSSAGRIRKLGADYLCYALIDAVVDHYFVMLDKIAMRIEQLEEEMLPRPQRDSVQRIHELRRDMILLRKAVWPLREVIAGMPRSDSQLIHESTEVYLRDVHDHVVQVTDAIDTHRDMLAGMLDLYHSAIANRTNEIMKVLTLFSSIFMPLTVITGIFGMNFKDFPLLEWHWGFAGVMLAMLLIGVAMFGYFRRRRWI